MRSRYPIASIWDETLTMMEQADRLHRRFFQLERLMTAQPTWAPPVDVFETEREVAIIVALPGVAAEQLVVALDDEGVTIRGSRSLPLPGEAADIVSLEIPYGQFERKIDLPPGRYRVGQRLLQDGCLVLTLRKGA